MNKKGLFHIGFIIPLVAFIVHQILQLVLSINIPFLDAYLDPFCASAMACYLIRLERGFLFGEKHFTWIDAAVLIAFLSIVTEWIFPIFSERFVSDWGDVISISLGAVWYMVTTPKD